MPLDVRQVSTARKLEPYPLRGLDDSFFAAVYAVALLATLAPSLRAARIGPAEALRYR